ncbi:MAG: DUF1007 family protein [Burkholderiaceae bacterium]|nr:DUF1007 family protein [Burkholderiaceae bacterium]
MIASLLRWLASALLLCGVAGAAAHPHGRLDCSLALQADGQGRLQGVALALVLDAASSQSLRPRLQLDAPHERQGQLFAQMLAGMFRHSGWMLQLRGAEAGPDGAALDLQDPEPPRWRTLADGRLELAVDLKPAAGAPALDGLQIACRDPVWYWLTGFAEPAQIQAPGSACQARLDGLGDAAEQAQALQAAARQAGAPGADRMAEGLERGPQRLSPTARLACPG